MNKDSELIWEAYNTGVQPDFNSVILEAIEEVKKGTGEPPVIDKDVEKKKSLIDRMTLLDKIQAALDIVGISPEAIGTGADAANIAISVVRGLVSAFKAEGSEVKRHAINAGISAISMIPFADFLKILKIRTLARSGKIGKAAAQASLQGLKGVKAAGKTAKAVRAGDSGAKLAKDDPRLAQAIQTAQGLQS